MIMDKNNDSGNEEKIKGPCIKVRYIQVTLLFFLMTIMFLTRVCLSVAIVAMTNNTSSNPDIPTYDWSNTNIILSSFFWSYAVLQFIAGNVAHIMGTRWLLLVTMFMNSVGSILIPVTAKFLGSNGVMFWRIIQGVCQGLMLPSLNSVLGRWVPPDEISPVNGIIYAGNAIGIALSMIITGYLAASSWGWPSSFYVFGVIGLIWCVFWFLLGDETPAAHRNISMQERKYIEQSLGQQDDYLIDKKSVPWKAIFKSMPYWAILVASIGESWGSTFQSSELPSYFSHAVGLDIENSSLFSAYPVVATMIASLCYGPLAAFTINKGYTSKANSRRIFHGIGSFSLALGLAFLPFMEDRTTIAVLLITSSAASAGMVVGHLVNQIDISPRYVGILCGFSNGTGQLVAILAPVLVHFAVTDETDKTLWRSMFIVAAVICSLTGVFFIIFCSADRQWWDSVDQDKLQSESKENVMSSNGVTNDGFEKDFTHNC